MINAHAMMKENSLWIMIDQYMLIATMGVTFGLVFMVMNLMITLNKGIVIPNKTFLYASTDSKTFDQLVEKIVSKKMVVDAETQINQISRDSSIFPLYYYSVTETGKEVIYCIHSDTMRLNIERSTISGTVDTLNVYLITLQEKYFRPKIITSPEQIRIIKDFIVQSRTSYSEFRFNILKDR